MDRFDDYTLLELIGQVARLADLEHPERVTQHQFDIAAASDQRFTSLPRARNLTRLLHQSWGDLVELSLRDPGSRRRALAARQRAENATWLTREQAIYTLRLACRRLGGQASLTPGEFRRQRDRLIAHAKHDADTISAALPDEHQIAAIFADWDSALQAAGLARRDPAAPRPQRRAPSVAEILERCYEKHGTLPTKGELLLFAQANRIPFPSKLRDAPYHEHVKAWQRSRRDAGLPFPERYPRKRDRPDYSKDLHAQIDGHRPPGSWTLETIMPWAARFLDQLGPHDPPTRRAYMDWVARTPGAPAASTLGQHGGYSTIMNKARQRRRAST